MNLKGIDTNKVIYIAGPMTGLKNLNFDKFNEVEAGLRHLGYNRVLNPAKLEEVIGKGRTYAEYFKAALQLVLAADVLFVLCGWEGSKGARAEVDVARLLAKKIIFEQDIKF